MNSYRAANVEYLILVQFCRSGTLSRHQNKLWFGNSGDPRNQRADSHAMTERMPRSVGRGGDPARPKAHHTLSTHRDERAD